jgi:predicted component of type VI protein secretion system
MQLVIQSGVEAGKVFDLTQSVVIIGRQVGNDIVLADSQISRRHIQISSQNGALTVMDLGSANGSFINGQPLPPNVPVPFRVGDSLKVGDTVLGIRQSAPAYAPPPDMSNYGPTATMVEGYPASPPQTYNYNSAPPYNPNYNAAPAYNAPPAATNLPKKSSGGGAGLIIGIILALIVVGGGIGAIFLLTGNSGGGGNNLNANTPVSSQPTPAAIPTTAPGRTGTGVLPPPPPRRSEISDVEQWAVVSGQTYSVYWVDFLDD